MASVNFINYIINIILIILAIHASFSIVLTRLRYNWANSTILSGYTKWIILKLWCLLRFRSNSNGIPFAQERCPKEWRPSRLESECVPGEGVRLTFPSADCSFLIKGAVGEFTLLTSLNYAVISSRKPLLNNVSVSQVCVPLNPNGLIGNATSHNSSMPNGRLRTLSHYLNKTLCSQGKNTCVHRYFALYRIAI